MHWGRQEQSPYTRGLIFKEGNKEIKFMIANFKDFSEFSLARFIEREWTKFEEISGAGFLSL